MKITQIMSKTFSTLNRWLGRRNKEKSVTNGKLSESNKNLSLSSTNVNESVQLDYNRITPLPVATSNAPFEQTFRITVLLPKDQLYVARLGARVPLRKLLELVCDNKLLDLEKYEFRNPVDPSQVYDCNLTIGAVGLSEIRLCFKTDSYDTFNADEIIKLHRSSLIRESLSSSEFSSRFSKRTTKTTSPYSSSNSLNSMESIGPICIRNRSLLLAHSNGSIMNGKLTAPPRKKRTAPLPPCQIAIPEKDVLVTSNNSIIESIKFDQDLISNASSRDLSISTPNLSSSTTMMLINQSDINGNDFYKNNNILEIRENNKKNQINIIKYTDNGYTDDTVLYAQVQKKNALNLEHGITNSNNNNTIELNGKQPEPTPRKRIIPKKKKTAPPAPPPRNSLYSDDVISVNLESSPSPIEKNIETIPRAFEKDNTKYDNSHNNIDTIYQLKNDIPKPIPRMTTTTLLNAIEMSPESILQLMNNNNNVKNSDSTSISINSTATVTASKISTTSNNISKVLLNYSENPEPFILADSDSSYDHNHLIGLRMQGNTSPDDDSISKQADSGIGEPIPSPLPDSLQSEISILDCKSNFESSSDDDDMIKVYDFKLGKMVVKPIKETKSNEVLTILNNQSEIKNTDNMKNSTIETTIDTKIETPISKEKVPWSLNIPLKPPPNFADNQKENNINKEKITDSPITPKITERPILNFAILQKDNKELNRKNTDNVYQDPKIIEMSFKKDEIDKSITNYGFDKKTAKSPTTPIDGLVEELSMIIQSKGVDSLIRKPKKLSVIKAVKSSTLQNFTISAITSKDADDPRNKNVSDFLIEDDQVHRKHQNMNNMKQPHTVIRADSFHAMASTYLSNDSHVIGDRCLTHRSSSQQSLNKVEQLTNGSCDDSGDNSFQLNNRRSSNELKIRESPSLQSLEVIKTILNNNKQNNSNSSINVSSEEEAVSSIWRPAEVLKITSLEMKPKITTFTSLSKELASKSTNRQQESLIVQKNPTNANEVPKLYRYSGPPSINVGTWHERPKTHVAIKNEGDYIFGGNNRTLNEVIEETTKTTKKLQQTEKQQIDENQLNSHNQKVIHTNTLPRSNEKCISKTCTDSIYATSKHRINKTQMKDNFEQTRNSTPFSQSTLRNTGLKEKILAEEKYDQQYNNVVSTITNNEAIKNHINLMKFNQSTLNVKLISKIQNTYSEIDNESNIAKPHSTDIKSIQMETKKSPPLNIFTTSQKIKIINAPCTTNISIKSTPSPEPNAELLAAIRNFNKTQLRKSTC